MPTEATAHPNQEYTEDDLCKWLERAAALPEAPLPDLNAKDTMNKLLS